jgi:hypothetical protein
MGKTLAGIAAGTTVAIALAVLLVGDEAGAEDRCVPSCFEAKSAAYQRCRSIPAASRRQREACFKDADSKLAQCLRRCRGGR